MADDLPFRAEYAKSGRASCKACKGKIDKDSLRLAKMTQSPMFDGKVPNWFHEKCFFGNRSVVKNVDDIAHFDQLRWEDQDMLRKKVEGAGKEFLAAQLSSSTASLEDYTTEYAKSGRSLCRSCNVNIEKGVVRISKKDYESPRAIQNGPQDQWYHVDCFVKDREELDFYAAAEKLKGFKRLKGDDQEDLKKKLPLIKNAEAKRAASSSSNQPAKKQKTEDPKENKLLVQLQKQNDLLYKYRDKLKDLPKKVLKYLLEYNKQAIPSGESRLLDCLADCMAFGKLIPCPECKNGQLVYQRDGYRCTGDMSEWTKCTYVTKTPQRQKFEVPAELKENYDFLKKYKYKDQERVLPPEAVPSSIATAGASSSGNSTSAVNSLPLSGMKFVVLGKLSKTKGEITKAVEELGGTITSKIEKSTAAILSTEDEVKKMSKKMQEAKEANVQVVSEDFLESVKKGGAILMIRDKAICDWGSDPLERIGDASSKLAAKKRKAEEHMFTKSVPAKLVMKVKGAAAVDPDSGLDSVAHVLEEKDNIYNAILGLVDIERGTNSFYKLQVLEADSGNRYWVFRSWGRVGTTIGGNKVEPKTTKSEAIKSFYELYEEKTGNRWQNRANFKKQPNRFYPLDIDYGQEDENVKKLSDLAANSKSKLHKAVQNLICMIFDVESMKKAMVEFEIDLKKMPLGKLSRKQIENAYSVLTELMQLIQNGGTAAKFLDASNRFYTLIPHDFRMKKPTPLDNEEIIKQKIEMLDNLLEIEVAYNLLKGAEGDHSKDVLDVHYEKLKTDIEYLEKNTEDFKRIKEYVKNTHAATHNQYDLEVMEAFKVNRHGERSRFKPFKQLHNRKLLWHGSRVTNFAGILSQGLRIAPPEAPATGYMFGKGVYFADMVSKSANYCCAYKNNPIGIMMLCEVALGNMHELTHSDFITKLPSGKHSTKGCGRTAPDPSKAIKLDDGLEIPLGPGINAPVQNTSLLYNEYIVYDVAQINIKYLLKMNFKWKY